MSMLDDLERLMCILDELDKIKHIDVEDVKKLIRKKILENRSNVL